MGLLRALGRNGLKALQSGHMFSVPGAERGMTSQAMGGVANRIAAGVEVSPDIELGRVIAAKFYAGEKLTAVERAIFDEMLVKVRDRKAKQMLAGVDQPTSFDDFIE